MIDIPERIKMQEAIILLLENKLSWDEFDSYYSNLRTKDLAIYEIGEYFWVAMDPEYPSNRPNIEKEEDIIFRSMLFLSSTCEYLQKTRNKEYWPFSGENNYSTEYEKNGRNLKEKILSLKSTQPLSPPKSELPEKEN